MDSKFLPAMAAIRTGNAAELNAMLERQPQLAAERSSCSHPTLMQCLVLDGVKHESEVQIAMAKALLRRGSPVDEPLIAAASIGNVVLAQFLLDRGAAISGSPDVAFGWTALEESLYWDSPQVTELLLARGAAIPNLRAAAGLGRLGEMARFFDDTGAPRTDCGGINSPFGNLGGEKDDKALQQQLLDNALSYSAMAEEAEAAELLIEKGADVNSHPLGFHYRGTALHWAAIRGHRKMCELLLARGADPAREDLTIQKTPADWARHESHEVIAAFLEATG